ncbi:MAG: DUF6377 domain-containing protein [Alistipes sp.]
MKVTISTKVLISLAGCLLLAVACTRSLPEDDHLAAHDTKILLRILEHSFKDKTLYQQQQQQRIDSIVGSMHRAPKLRQQLRATLQLMALYSKHNVDTAYVYAYKAHRTATALNDYAALCNIHIRLSRLNIASNRLTDAAENLEIVREKWFEWARKDAYYGACRLMFEHKAFYEIRDSLSQRYRIIARAYRDSVLQSVSPNRMTYAIEMSRLLEEQQRYEEALQYTKPLLERERKYTRLAPLAYEIARIYRKMPNSRDSTLRYLTMAAICDLRAPVRDGVAIRDLAHLLLGEDDLTLANRCINSVVEDAVASHALERIQSATALSKEINDAYIQRIQRQKTNLNYMIWVLGLLTVLLMVMARLQIRKNRKISSLTDRLQVANDFLSQANIELNTKNTKLSELSNIKDGYIGGYMNLCTSYISMLEEYRQNAYRIANKSGIDKAVSFLRSPLFIEHEYKKFYQHFDTTFLGMFPDFVEQVNTLLTPDNRFSVVQGGGLTTELRILAALRLGITNSVRIAEFLHCSKATIFTYRTKMRNGAQGERNDFEHKVMNIAMRTTLERSEKA